MAKRAFEDFTAGDVVPLASRLVQRSEIIAFATEFDPRPHHLDEQADLNGPGLSAAKWHLTALFMRMAFDGWLGDSTCLGSPGLDRVEWPAPVGPGDRLSGSSTVVEARPLKSRQTMGIVRFRHELTRQDGTVVLSMDNPILMERREPSPAADPGSAVPRSPLPARDSLGASVWDLGSKTFSADAIKRFARAFDPQRFHLDEAEARASHFGALCASGWQTAATHHRLLVARLADEPVGLRADLLDAGTIRDLKWSKPVFAGDTIRYFVAFDGPGQGTPNAPLGRHQGVNQSGDVVFSFTTSALPPSAGASG